MMSNSILIITSYDGPYGGNFIASINFLNNKLKTEGFRTIYVFQEKVKSFSWIPEVEKFADRVVFLPYLPNSFSNIMQIRKIVKEEKPRLIYSRMCGWDIAAHLAAPNIPIVWHMEMNPNLHSFFKKVKYFGKYRILGRKNVYSVSVSLPGRELLNSLNLKNKCICIQNSADFSRLPSSPKKITNKTSPENLLIFGYNPSVKGLDLAIDACEIINREQIRCNLLVSSQVRTYEYINDRYGDNIPPWLNLLPPTDDIASLYNNADILISASRSEGFSFCLLEALYSGLPAVYSDITGTNWADEMKGVYKFKSGNVDGLVKAINDCIENGISTSDQEYNRAIINEKYSLENWANEFFNMFIELLN